MFEASRTSRRLPRSRPRDARRGPIPGALVTRADAEAAIGALATNPRVLDDRCVYDGVAGNRPLAPSYVMQVKWTGGFSEFRQHNEETASFTKGMIRNMPLSADQKAGIESLVVGDELENNPAWERAHYSVMGLSAVKKDVLVTIEPRGGTSATAVKLMEKAMSRF